MVDQSKSEILFEYRWVIVREIDRINRQTQTIASLDARVMKLRGLATPFLQEMRKDKKRNKKAKHWLEWWRYLSDNEYWLYEKGPRWVRWKQFELLIALFHDVGVFLEDAIPWENITLEGVETEGEVIEV